MHDMKLSFAYENLMLIMASPPATQTSLRAAIVNVVFHVRHKFDRGAYSFLLAVTSILSFRGKQNA